MREHALRERERALVAAASEQQELDGARCDPYFPTPLVPLRLLPYPPSTPPLSLPPPYPP